MDRVGFYITLLLGGIFGSLGVLLLIVLDAPLRWFIGLPFLVIGLLNLGMGFAFRPQAAPDVAGLRDVGADGRPVVGNERIRQMVDIVQREMGQTPHRIMTGQDALAVEFELSDVAPTGGDRHFMRRVTLWPTSRPNVFRQVDQHLDERRGRGWRTGSVSSGVQRSINTSVRVNPDGSRSTRTVVVGDPMTAAVRTAVKEIGSRTTMPAGAIVGLVNAGVGLLVGLGGALIAIFYGS